MKDITKEEFEAYEKVRVGGLTNMFNTKNVIALSGLSKDKIIEIMKKYGELEEKFKEKEKCQN